MELPYSQASENNKDPILEVISGLFLPGQSVLEIGAGSGQHAVYFAQNLTGVNWQPADQEKNLWAIQARVDEAGLDNLLQPFELEVTSFDWSTVRPADHVFSANTAHIMPWVAVCAMFVGVGEMLGGEGAFVLYGPFNRNGAFTSDGNRQFDQSLRSGDSEMGIRDDTALVQLAHLNGLKLINDIDMPANNRVLVWQKAS